MKTTLSLLAVALLATPAFAQNDECTGAIALTAGVPTAFDTTAASTNPADPIWPCALGGGPDIWYTFTTTQAASVEVSTCNNAAYDTAIQIFSGGCGVLTPLVCNDDGPGCAAFSSLAVASGVPVGTTLHIRIGGYNGATGTGTVTVTEVITPCSTPDTFEPNTDCSSAAPVGDGTYSNLNVSDSDSDYYSVNLAANGTLDVELFFLNATADLDLYLWDPAVACDSNVVGEGLGTGALAVGFTATDDEFVTYTNTTGAAQNLIIETRIWSSSAGTCNEYTLVVSGAGPGGPANIGTPFCAAVPNSTGVAGLISAFGSTDASNNDVTLTASNLPVGQFGIFVTSSTIIAGNPVGSGLLCLGGQAGRYNLPGQILTVNGSGEFSLALNLNQTPLPAAFTAVMAGDTRGWQAWHRDFTAGGAGTSNFTNGVSITFN